MTERVTIHHGELESKPVILKNGRTYVSVNLSKKDPEFVEIFCPPKNASNVTYMVLKQNLEEGGWEYERCITKPDSKTKFNLKNGAALQINLINTGSAGKCSVVTYRIIYARGTGFYYTNAHLIE